MFVGLTGGIGAGKSAVLEAFQRAGYATVSADRIVHELLGEQVVRDLLILRWGQAIAPAGEVDRDRVAEIVFKDEKELGWLEDALFPRVGDEIVRWRSQLAQLERQPLLAVAEAPLLFEAGVEQLFDMTVCVVTKDELRERRAVARGHLGIAGRAARQLSQEEKARRSNYVLDNDGSLAELDAKVKGLAKEIIEDAQAK